MKDHQYLMNGFHRAGKTPKPDCKVLRVSTKNEENLEKSRENV